MKTITEDKNATAKLVIPVTYHGSSPYNGVIFFNQKTNRHAVKKTTAYLEFANREKKLNTFGGPFHIEDCDSPGNS